MHSKKYQGFSGKEEGKLNNMEVRLDSGLQEFCLYEVGYRYGFW